MARAVNFPTSNNSQFHNKYILQTTVTSNMMTAKLNQDIEG